MLSGQHPVERIAELVSDGDNEHATGGAQYGASATVRTATSNGNVKATR